MALTVGRAVSEGLGIVLFRASAVGGLYSWLFCLGSSLAVGGMLTGLLVQRLNARLQTQHAILLASGWMVGGVLSSVLVGVTIYLAPVVWAGFWGLGWAVGWGLLALGLIRGGQADG